MHVRSLKTQKKELGFNKVCSLDSKFSLDISKN
jgi:hypothetical protein